MAKAKSTNTGQLSTEMKSYVDNYSGEIKQIKEFVEAVRLRPGMYIGPLGGPGFLNMIREVFQNAMDQMVSAKSPCTMVSIMYDMRTEVVTIMDDGLGIPFNDMEKIYTKQHVSKNYVKQKGDYSSGLNGIGAKATNALSKEFVVTSYHYSGTALQMTFRKGKLVEKKELSNRECKQGTTVTFLPDHSIMGDTYLPEGILFDLIRDMLSLTQIGNKVYYSAVDKNGVKHQELLVNEHGILTNLYVKCPRQMIDPIVLGCDTGTMKLDAAFTFDSVNINGEDITAYANMCPTSTVPMNTHVKGFLDGVCYWFVKHMNTIWLPEKSKTKINSNDVKASLSAIISAFHLEPQFTGQAKEVFSNKDFEPFAKDTTMKALDEWAKNRPADLQKVCKYLKDIADARMRADSEKVKVTAKYNKSPLSGLPEKYYKPTGPASEGWELIIVEGDSAGGAAKDGRDVRRQGIFPIRGKILNVFDATPDKIANNAEIIGIRDILNAGFGNTFDVSKVKFKKIIFMTDADADGDHIASLLMLLFLKFFPGLVESGMVYKAVPPLYGIRDKKKNMIYFTERIDFAKYVQETFFKNNKVSDMTGKALTPSKFANMLVDYEDYVYYMTEFSNLRKADPDLIAILLEAHVRKTPFKKIQKQLIDRYRFLDESCIQKIGDTIRIKGLIGNAVETIFFNDKFLVDCRRILPYTEKAVAEGRTEFLLNGIRVSLYTLLKATEGDDSGIYRYKGLGEMDGDQLSNAVLHPDSNRLLIRYTTQNLKEDIKRIRELESDKKRILRHVEKVNRIDLLG